MSRGAKAYSKSGPAIDSDEVDNGAAAHQTIVKTTVAAVGVTKPAGAVASIFEAGVAATPPRAPRTLTPMIDIATVTIRSGLPIPAAIRGPGQSPYALLLAKMKAGDSVELPDRQCAGLAAMAKKLKLGHAMRRTGPGVKGFWRTE